MNRGNYSNHDRINYKQLSNRNNYSNSNPNPNTKSIQYNNTNINSSSNYSKYPSYPNNQQNKNFTKNTKSSSDDLILEDVMFIDPEELKEYCREDPENIKIVEVECPINSDIMMIDISMNPKGRDEELVYLDNPEYMKNIRRGNTLLDYYSYRNGTYNLEYSTIGRKGMIKFMDLPYELVQIDKDNYKNWNKIRSDKNLNNARKVIMEPILRSLTNNNTNIEVFKLIKANGENAQISYSKENKAWIIASKNVGILARNRSDLDYYQPINKKGESTRYKFAYIIGQRWFDTIENYDKNLLENFKEFLSDKTLIGEYVGNQYHQHLIRYMKHTILFYSIVNNYSEETCIPVIESYQNFKKYKLDVVPYERIGIFNTHRSLCEALDKLYIRIAESSIIDEEEGSVLYITENIEDKGKTYNRVIVLCKLKTLEYRVYRKLREKLKNHLIDCQEKGYYDSRRKINQFFEEVRVMLQGYTLPMPMHFYYKVAETAFAFVNKYYSKCENLHSFYIDFIETIHSIIDQTVDLKSRAIKCDNIMTYDYLIKNELISKKVIEIIIYAPPLYLTEDFLKLIEKNFQTVLRNTFIQNKEYININSDSQVIIYHINMHNFRHFNKLDENKFIFVFGLKETNEEKCIKILNEKLNNPQFISYNTNGNWGLGIGDWGLGIGDWGLGIGDWAQSPIPNPQSPIPNPQSPIPNYN